MGFNSGFKGLNDMAHCYVRYTLYNEP